MIEEVWSYIQDHGMLEPSDGILVAVSGGADSVCLLLLLNELRQRFPQPLTIEAIHIEHGIRGEDSLHDADFVARLCDRLQIPLHTDQYRVEEYARKQGIGVEEAGRKLRYQSFEKEADRMEQELGHPVRIAIAHNANDNAETVLFHLARGTGLDGLRGIPGCRDRIIRPLLCVSRAQIEAELARRHQEYCTDITNLSDDYDRNKIRHQVLPVLTDINSGALEHITRTTGMLQEISDFIHRECTRILAQVSEVRCIGEQEELAILQRQPLLEQDMVIQKAVIHQWISQYAMHGRDITAGHIQDVLLVLQQGVDKMLYLPYQLWIYTTYDTLIMGRGGQEASQCIARLYAQEHPLYRMDGEKLLLDAQKLSTEMSLPATSTIRMGQLMLTAEVVRRDPAWEIPRETYVKWFDFDKISGKLYVRNRNAGDYFTVNVHGGRKKFKDYCINEKIPRPLRDEIPLVCQGSEILWAVGYRISEKYKIDENTRTILKIKMMEEKVQ